jgi:hypothetical protein
MIPIFVFSSTLLTAFLTDLLRKPIHRFFRHRGGNNISMKFINNHFIVVVTLFIYVTSLFISAAVYHHLEDWHFGDAFYFAVITQFTIGYGDFTPQTSGGKWFSIFFIFFSVANLAGFLIYFLTHNNNNSYIIIK